MAIDLPKRQELSVFSVRMQTGGALAKMFASRSQFAAASVCMVAR
jgi:hypothetical protein